MCPGLLLSPLRGLHPQFPEKGFFIPALPESSVLFVLLHAVKACAANPGWILTKIDLVVTQMLSETRIRGPFRVSSPSTSFQLFPATLGREVQFRPSVPADGNTAMNTHWMVGGGDWFGMPEHVSHPTSTPEPSFQFWTVYHPVKAEYFSVPHLEVLFWPQF
jgi:hypothetical protein